MEKAFSILITGLPASGKTTTARLVQSLLIKSSFNVEVLDGDEIRKNLSNDLGFKNEDRIKHSRRISYVAKLLNKHDIIVIISIIAPLKQMRNIFKSELSNFVEIYLKCSPEVCEKRDIKSNYVKARAGKILNFTGISAEYEEPENPDLVINSEINSAEKVAQLILDKLLDLNLIQSIPVYSSEEEEQIKNQLKNLGYF